MTRVCPACTTEQTFSEFRRHSSRRGRPSVVCNWCWLSHPGLCWCLVCGWQPTSSFYLRSSDGRPHMRCKPCFLAHRHGTTVAEILSRQGADVPECASCGAVEDLQIHHDHACCPGETGCARCVEGYLCRGCNVAEAWIRSPGQALGLALFLVRARAAQVNPPDDRPERVA